MDLVSAPLESETALARLRVVLGGVLATLGLWLTQPQRAVLMYRRVSRALVRIERLMVRFRAGRLWQIQGRVRGARAERAAPLVAPAAMCALSAGRGPALPLKFGWLVRDGGWRAAGYGSQLQAVLSAPEMVALMEACPQARRILRPVCRAFALEVPQLARPARVRVVKPRKPRTRKVVEPFRIPLPRGVISAARRQGYGRMV